MQPTAPTRRHARAAQLNLDGHFPTFLVDNRAADGTGTVTPPEVSDPFPSLLLRFLCVRRLDGRAAEIATLNLDNVFHNSFWFCPQTN